jgi:hypothetical protein
VVAEQVTSEKTADPQASETRPEPQNEASNKPEPVPDITPEPRPEPPPAPEPKSEPVSEPASELPHGQEVHSPDAGEKVVVDGGMLSDAMQPETVPETPKNTFNWAGHVFDFFTPGNPAVSGVKVCVYQNTSIKCSTSSTSGKFVLFHLTLNADYHVTFEKAGWMPLVVPIHVPRTSLDGHGEFIHRVGMVAEQTAKLVGTLMGVNNVDLTNKAHVVVDVHESQQNTVAGVSITMSPQNGQGPFYTTTSGTKNPKPETSAAGLAIFLNVTPGTYEFSYTHATKSCKNWPSTIADSTGKKSKGLALKGYLLVTSGLCQ